MWFNAGDVTCLATIPFDMEVEAHFLAKEDGIVAGISLAEMIFHEVDPSLKVLMHSLLFLLLVWFAPLIILDIDLILGRVVSEGWRLCSERTAVWKSIW